MQKSLLQPTSQLMDALEYAGAKATLPFEMMKEGFEKAGIKVDSSVMQGCKIYANDMGLDE